MKSAGAPLIGGALLLGIALALGLPKAPPPQSRPSRVTFTLGTAKPRHLPGPSELGARFPAVAALDPAAQRVVAIALSDLAAPCAPCWEPEPRRLSECALDAPRGCENLPRLVARVAAAAARGERPEKVREAGAYGDIWVAGVAPPEAGPPVPVELWLDPASPVVGDAAAVARALGDGPVPIHLQLRIYASPERPYKAEKLARLGVVAAREEALLPLAACLGAARAAVGTARAWATGDAAASAAAPALATLEACAPLPLERWESAADAEEIGASLGLSRAQAEARGVRSGPTWFVNGYRLRGPRSAESLAAAVARELAETPGAPE